jgi:4-amino-4-deoxy-L-arabinose transferase-like glycosyltransferase
MVRRRSPFYLFSELHCNLSNGWSDKTFAGTGEMPSGDRLFSSRFAPVLLFLLAGLLCYSRLNCPLLEPEEARYAEIPRQMLAEGRWLTPVLHGEDYYQKPPLLYWLIMLSYQVFGVHDWAARLVPTTASILTILVSYAWARQTVGPRSAFLSGVILCLSARFLYLGGMINMDSLLCLFVVGGLACGHMALQQDEGVQKDEGGRMKDESDKSAFHASFSSFSLHPSSFLFASAVCCGLGILTKGPVAAVLILVPLVVWTFLERCPARFRLWLLYFGVALLIAAPWYVITAWHDPQASSDFFWLHNIVRYFAPLDHEKPAWFYLPGLLLGMLPWSLVLVPLVVDLKDRSLAVAQRRPAALGFFLLAAGWCVVFFSISGCKRPAYILPALPALALALGTYCAHVLTLSRRVWTWIAAGAASLTLVLLAGNLFWLPAYHSHFGLRTQVEPCLNSASTAPVICYPRRWDSVSFYLQRPTTCFTADELSQMIAAFETTEAWLFVKNDKSFMDLLAALPPHLEFVSYGQDDGNVRVGTVKRKEH